MEDTLDNIKTLIDQRRWSEAHAMSKPVTEDECDNANAWSQRVLLAGLLGDMQDYDFALGQLIICSNYTTEMEGDIYADQAQIELRRGNLDKAAQLIDKADEVHAGDANRLARNTMVRGRIAYKERNFKKAAELHEKAWKMFQEIGPKADIQWMTNTNFHWMCAAARQGWFRTFLTRVRLWNRHEDESIRRSIGVALMLLGGRLGAKLVDRVGH